LKPLESEESIHLRLIQTETNDTDANVAGHRLNLIKIHLSQSIQDAVKTSPDLAFDASLAIMRNCRLIEMMSFMSLFQN